MPIVKKEDNQILSSNLLFDVLAKLLITLSMSGNISEWKLIMETLLNLSPDVVLVRFHTAQPRKMTLNLHDMIGNITKIFNAIFIIENAWN